MSRLLSMSCARRARDQRVLCDTNVLVSAFIAAGPSSRVIEAAIDGRIDLVLADTVLDELDRVLSVKLGFEPERIRTASRAGQRMTFCGAPPVSR